VRTAYPTTGGFDEGATLFCVHPSDGSSHIFDRFLPEIADDRSVYAPDLPGFGESDPALEAPLKRTDAVGALIDLARDLRLQQIDVLGFRCGGWTALELAAAMPGLVRRLVLIAVPPIDRLPVIEKETLVLRIAPGQPGDDSAWTAAILPRARFLDATVHVADLFDGAPQTLAGQIRDFLS
jgi:pimeloyl-ACP methyl ester carboxylesterase